MDDPTPRLGGAIKAFLLTWGPGLVVCLGAGVVTAHGLYVVAVAAGVPISIAWLYPLITDGLGLVAYAATHRLSKSATRYAWAVVVIATGLSGLAQAIYLSGGTITDISPEVRLGVGAWPAVAAATAAHLLHLLRSIPAETAKDGTPSNPRPLVAPVKFRESADVPASPDAQSLSVRPGSRATAGPAPDGAGHWQPRTSRDLARARARRSPARPPPVS